MAPDIERKIRLHKKLLDKNHGIHLASVHLSIVVLWKQHLKVTSAVNDMSRRLEAKKQGPSAKLNLEGWNQG